MFPLGTVLFPGTVLPLHVFEPRYRALVVDCLRGQREFGVVLIERGSEVGGGEVRTNLGTITRIVDVAPLPGGRYALTTVGIRRIRITEWLPDDPYPRAVVEEWPDDDLPVDPARLAEVERAVRRTAALATELGDPTVSPASEIDAEPTMASYHLSHLAPLGPADRQALLAAPGPAARLELLATFVADAEELLRARLAGS